MVDEAVTTSEARIERAMDKWRRRSRLIRFLRRALPSAIGAVFAVLIGWILVNSVLANLPNLNPGGATIRMTNPHFYGQDDNGRSFTVGGREAIRRRVGGRDVVELFGPALRLQTGPDRAVEVTARAGVYDEGSKLMRLNRDVHLQDTYHHTDFQTGEAVIDSRTGDIHGATPVSGRSPLGAVTASSYAIFDRGARIEFDGAVRSRIDQRPR